MIKHTPLRLIRLLVLLTLVMAVTSSLAQDVPTETPSETATEVIPTEAPTEVATDLPTETPTEVPTEIAPVTEIPTETASATVETPVPTTPVETEVPVVEPSPVQGDLAPESELTLVVRDLFDTLSSAWSLPASWTLSATVDGGAIQIGADGAGLNSHAVFSEEYANVAVMGYFTFVDQAGTAQLIVRDSAVGAYTATLDANGLVTLEKRDSLGASVVLGTAATSVQAATRGLRLSAIEGVLRVSVNNVEVIAVQDGQPLPAGHVSVGAVFTASGTILFDNFFLWRPAAESVPATVPPTQTPATEQPTEAVPVTEAATENIPLPAAPLPQAGLAAPVLSAPAVNAVVTTLKPTFTWAAVAGANRYHLRVTSDDTCLNTANGLDVTSTTTSFVPTTALNQGAYYFCVESQNTTNGNSSGFIGEIRRFVINISLSPANNATIIPAAGTVTANIPFTWTVVQGAVYTLQVDNDANFSSPIIDMGIPAASFTVAAQPYGVYYWRIKVNGLTVPDALARHVTVIPALPLAPIIQTPSTIPSAGFTNDTTPLLDWAVPTNWATLPPGQSLTYEVQLATANTFAPASLVAPAVTGIANTDLEWTATALDATPGKVYYWHVRALTNLGFYSPYSPTYSFTLDTVAPNAPTTLTAPVNNAVSTSARPAFSWGAVTGANRYILELSAAENFNTLGYGSPYTATAAAFTLPASQPQNAAPLYWRVRAKDAAGNESVPSASRALRIDYVTAPAEGFAKVLVGAATTSPIAFAWTAVPGLTGAVYSVSVFHDEAMTQLAAESGPIATATWTSPALVIGDYWWTLNVSNAMGTSLARRFVVSPPLPGAPIAAFAPASAGFTNDTTPTFNWGTPTVNPTNVADYELQISTVNTFATQVAGSPYIVVDKPFDITTALPTTPGQAYFWRVRARTALGIYGTFAPTLSFTLDTVAPNAPLTLAAPADNATLTTARPAFSWAAIAGANRYKLDLSTDNAFGNILPLPLVTTPSYASTTSLAQGTYYWRVWSLDAAGNQSPAPSAVRTFTIDYRTAPLANATSFTATTSNIVFSWGLVTGAPAGTTYTIEIDNNFDQVADQTLPAVTTATTAVGLAQGDYQYRLTVSGLFGSSGWRTFIVSPLLPGAPAAPFVPANASFTNDPTPTLQWAVPATNAANVTGYVVDLSTAANFTTPVAGSPFDLGNVTTFTPSALPNTAGQIYYWRVRAKAAFNQVSANSATQSFTLDTTPPADVTTLTAPVDAAILSASRPAFSWAAAAGASKYKIEIDTDNAFANPILLTATPTTASYPIPTTTTALPQGTYFWRVWGMDAASNISVTPSAIRTFTVNYSLTPADNAVITSAAASHVTFTWAPIGGTTTNTIRIEVDNNSNFSSPERRSPLLPVTTVSYVTSLTGSTPNTNPLPHGKYYWRILVTGHTNPPTSQARTFIISPTPPTAPALSTTTPTASTSDTTPLFGWNAVTSGAGATVTGYEFQLSTVSTFASLVGGNSVNIAGGSTIALTWSPALPDTPGQAYFARIRAVTNLGAVSAWSTTRSFTLDTEAPTNGPTLTAPANNAAVTAQKPTFTWAVLAGATQYDIRYGTQADLSGTAPIRVTTNSHIPTGNLLFKTYFWEVRAIDAAGNVGPWSTQFSFVISSPPGAAPTLWNYTNASPTLTWTALYWAASYEVQVSRNSAFTDIVWQTSGIAASGNPSVTVGVALAEGTYYWRVHGRLSATFGNLYAPYGAANTFTVQAP